MRPPRVKQPQPSQANKGHVWDILTVGTLLLTLMMLGYIILIGLQPTSSLNLFPPPTQAAAGDPRAIIQVTRPVSPTASVTPGVLAGSATPTILVTRATPTLATVAIQTTPTLTLTPGAGQATLTLTLETTATPGLTQTPARPPGVTPSSQPITTLAATPSPTHSPFTFTAMINYQIHPVLACDWSGVAGTVVDLKEQAARGYVVEVTDAAGTMRRAVVGSSPDYGPGGWELRLGERDTAGIWYVRLYTAVEPKQAYSEAYEITLTGVCQRNLAFVRFQQNH